MSVAIGVNTMNLEQIQRSMFRAIQQPLTEDEQMRASPVSAVADEIIRPNDRLTSFERLEIYNRQYWFRLLSALAEDFPGLQAIVGEAKFEQLSVAYLCDCPSQSFTLRDLGWKLESWLREHPQFIVKHEQLAMDVVRLEWADIEAFDAAELPRLAVEDIAGLGADPRLHLQPYVRLVELDYPADDWLLKVKDSQDDETDMVSNAVEERVHEVTHKKRPRLPHPAKTYVAVHRSDGSVFYKRLEKEAFALLRALQRGEPLSAAIENSVEWSGCSVEQVTGKLHGWFANWSSLGWFCKG
ncbi:MAG: DNA-binding domain-containing protein [Acidobacteriaceae bacterium]